MDILVDTREKLPITFQFVEGINIKSECLKVGDYTARHNDGIMDNTVIDRKSISDLFHSFTWEYDNEKAKWERAKELGLKYIIAIEAPAIEVRKGHTYQKDGQTHEVRKDGLSQVRQILTITRKYDVPIWWCASRSDMAFLIQEYFLTYERLKEKDGKRLPK